MKKPSNLTPPKWATRLLVFYCRKELLEDLQGDLTEYFERNVKTKDARQAKLIYILDVFKFFRLYTIRKPEFINLLIHWIMLSSYIKTSGRTIVRNKLFSGINIFGLAVSMSVGLLVISMLTDLTSYDDFHEKKNRIYRVITTDYRANEGTMTFASTSVAAGIRIRETIPGVEDLTLIRREFSGEASIGDSKIPVSALYADSSFLRVFSFPMIHGDPAAALREPYSLVLTQTSAKKLFGSEEALGKTVIFDTLSYVVTGILKDLPKLSHMNFEALVSFSTAEIQIPGHAMEEDFLNWTNVYSNYVYLVLPENTSPSTIQASIDRLAKKENASLKNRRIELELQPLSEIAIGRNLSNPIGPAFPAAAIWILVVLTVVIILSACFNYTNLSIARSLRRSREIGIRKVIGALKIHVLGQFIAESVIISLLALFLSFVFFLFLKKQFLFIHPFIQNIFALELSAKLILYFVCLAMGVGIVAGFLPALFYSRVSAIKVLKNLTSIPVLRRVTLRKALIVVQYTFSLIFITVTIIGYGQYKGFLEFDLGFTTENILNIRLQGNKSELLTKELNELPAVTDVSQSLMVTSLGSIYGQTMKYKDPNDSAGVWYNIIDDRYLPLHDHKLIAGRNFIRKPVDSKESEVIVNEQVLKRFGMKDPNYAVGQELIISGRKSGQALTIVGVVQDFHYGTTDNKIEPVVLRYAAEAGGYLNVKIQSDDLPATMAAIESAWKKIDKSHTLDARFYDDQIEEAYSQFSVMLRVIGFLAFLAVCISSLGLFGMVVFTTETRLREISIRKVLGASEGKLIYLLSKGFLILLGIAAIVALPLTYLFFDQVILENVAYHQPIGIGQLLAGVAMVMGLALLMIGSQTMKVAGSNPADVLRAE